MNKILNDERNENPLQPPNKSLQRAVLGRIPHCSPHSQFRSTGSADTELTANTYDSVVAVGLGETVSSERDKFGRNVDQENSSTDYKHLPYVQLFTEPEVAATYAFARWEKKELETLRGACAVIVDVCRSTTDIVSYFVYPTGNGFHHWSPPTRAGCGTHRLSEILAKLILEKTSSQHKEIKEASGMEASQIIWTQILKNVEYNAKPGFDLDILRGRSSMSDLSFNIPGYNPPQGRAPTIGSETGDNNGERFGQLIVTRELWNNVCQPWCGEIATLLHEELQSQCLGKPPCIGIFLIGEGADQPALLPYLQEEVVVRCNADETFKPHVKMMKSPLTRSSGAAGARTVVPDVVGGRAITQWIAWANFGVLLRVPYEADSTENSHRPNQEHHVRDSDNRDGMELVPYNSFWIILKDEEYTSVHKFDAVVSIHEFYDLEDEWIINEAIAVEAGNSFEWVLISDEGDEGHRIVQTIEDDVKQLVKSAGIQGRVWEQDFGKEACYSRGTLGAQNHM